jgi:phage tail sheath protein FI
VDVERGVHKAPANEVVRGIVTRDLKNNNKPLEFTLNKREHDILNPRGVNVIRDFRADGRDIRVWGARTMSSDSMWKYVNVRRLFIFIEQSIDRGTQWAVFEPNSEPTWIAVRTSITNFLRTIWRNGALMGTTQDEAFFVKCDRTTMTQDDFDNGRLICLIGVAPVKPAEFVIFRISQKTIEAES